jgi:Fur family zinc uptake transcriptional regulator
MTPSHNESHDHAPKLTKNQALVFEALTSAACPLSAYSILDELRDQGFRAPLQVYRALEKLLELGIVHRLETQNAFVACTHPSCDDTDLTHETVAFMICETCGTVAEIADAALQRQLQGLAGSENFALDQSVVELRGKCHGCADAGIASPVTRP